MSEIVNHININAAAQEAFNKAAAGYDTEFTQSPTGWLQRQRVYHFLQQQQQYFIGKNVLELNCGTGEDAAWFAMQGAAVTATDLAPNMIAQAQQKLTNRGLAARTIATGFDTIADSLRGEQFDFVFSNFGGLNCTSPEGLTHLGKQLTQLTHPGARLALVIMSNNCWWEKWYYRLKGNKTAAYRRQQPGSVSVSVNGTTLQVWYYSPRQLVQYLGKNFILTAQRPIGFWLPPSYMDNFFKRRKGVLRLLNWLEQRTSNWQWLANRADHYLIIIKRTG